MGMTGMDDEDSDVGTASVLAGLGDCPGSVRRLVEDLVAVCAEPVIGDLVTGAALSDRVTALARVRTVLDAEVARSLVAAESADVLPHAAATLLQRAAAWSGADASQVVAAGRLAARHPDLAALWRTGQVSAAVVAVIARGLRGVSADVESQFLAAVLPQLPRLSVKAVKLLVARTLDLLFPDDADAREQSDWDRRSLVATSHGGMTRIPDPPVPGVASGTLRMVWQGMSARAGWAPVERRFRRQDAAEGRAVASGIGGSGIATADLPGVEGEAVMAALDAIADSLRVAGDRATAAQRRADALITLVNRAATQGEVPATRSGLPVATTITIGVTEADRVATHQSKAPTPDLAEDLFTSRDPRATATTSKGAAVTLGDAALRFALCAGTHTGVLIDDRDGGGGGPVSSVLARTRVQPLAVGRAFRLATPAQRTALAVRDGGCILCHRPASECQTHHLTDWADGGTTDLDNLVLLCWTHHRQVDLNRWAITRNPDTSPDQPHWLITPVPRHQWKRRQPHPRAA